jgi:hypothetical protein
VPGGCVLTLQKCECLSQGHYLSWQLRVPSVLLVWRALMALFGANRIDLSGMWSLVKHGLVSRTA